jgi:hypothetical protein
VKSVKVSVCRNVENKLLDDPLVTIFTRITVLRPINQFVLKRTGSHNYVAVMACAGINSLTSKVLALM